MMAEPVKARLHAAAGRPADPISDRHRAWGAPCLATDLDLILLEYAPAGPLCALIEYKLGLDRTIPDAEAKAVLRLGELAERASLPAFCVIYGGGRNGDPWRFRVYPLGAYGSGAMIFARGETVTELTYVRFLYALRGLKLPADVAQDLDDR